MKKTNRKQKLVLWVVFALLILALFFPPHTYGRSDGYEGHHFIFFSDDYSIDTARWIGQILIVLLIGVGLFFALRSKENELESEPEPKPLKRRNLNLKRGFKRLTLSLAIVAGVVSAFFAVVTMYEEYEQSHIKVPDGFVLDQPGSSFSPYDKPVRLSDIPLQPFSTMELVGMCVLAGLGWGIAGFSSIWLVYLIALLLCMFIRWLVLGFCDNNRLRPEKP